MALKSQGRSRRLDNTVLVGREPELGIVEDLFEQMSERGGALIVRGEPGIGKSALLAEASVRAEDRGMRVLTATGVRSEAKVSFAGLHQLLRPIFDGLEELPVTQREAMLAAFGMTDDAAPDMFLIALAALNLVADSADRMPLVLVAEDAHWLDRSTADVLAFIARRLASDPILLLVACRDRTGNALDDAGVPEIILEGLGKAAAAELLDTHAPGLVAPLRERVLTEAAGNPLALVELATTAVEFGEDDVVPVLLPLTARLERTFAARASELPAATETLLLAAALNDSDALPEMLAAASIVAEAAIDLSDLEPALSAGLVEVDERAVRFRHPLMRSAIVQAAAPAQRHAVHAALAAVLDDQPDRRVWHKAASTVGADEGVATELEAAASRAQRRGALGAAAAGLEKAARLSRPGEEGPRLLRAAGLALELGRRDMVLRLVREAELLQLSPLDLGRLAWIVETMDPGITGDPRSVLPLVETAERVRANGDVDLALKLLWGAASNSFWADRSEQTHDEIVAAAERISVHAGDPRLLSILAYAAPAADEAALVERLSRWPADRGVDPTSMQLLGNAAFTLGVHALASGFLTSSIDTMRDQGRLVQLAQSLVMRAWSEINLGRWTVASPDAEEGARLAHETAQPIWEAGADAAQAFLAGVRGDEATAEALATRAERVVVPAGGRAVIAAVQLARGVTALGAGRYADAHRHLLRMLDRSDPAHHRMTFSWALGNLAESAVRVGETENARAVVAGFEQRAAQTPSPAFQQAMRHARAVLADDAEAEALFEAALDGEIPGGPFERARLQVAFGAWLRRQRRIGESRGPLRAARDTFDALGADPWSERAREELRAAGESSRKREPGALEELTPQELQVAQMAAEGLSNREIAQKLYLSHRTVGSHLYRIYPKLGINSRWELSAVLERSATVDV
jgi:DNA-binding CsgD family transcriptional regulator